MCIAVPSASNKPLATQLESKNATVVFECLTEKHLPDLYKLLKDRNQILSMISLSWFLTFFFSVLDHKVALNIINCVFLQGTIPGGTLHSQMYCASGTGIGG
ncbi:hypothetical protein EMCRGX_G010797 [Ephydatia muelleri]